MFQNRVRAALNHLSMNRHTEWVDGRVPVLCGHAVSGAENYYSYHHVITLNSGHYIQNHYLKHYMQ